METIVAETAGPRNDTTHHDYEHEIPVGLSSEMLGHLQEEAAAEGLEPAEILRDALYRRYA
ncbi:MAG: hypothetical protein HN341_08370 [Verrucomicrobia bacterium]|jgi:hypothetical protein|nr:hypothetical protein [Verrucomicrobiota bacterium]